LLQEKYQENPCDRGEAGGDDDDDDDDGDDDI
jgi:hypothetical protein